jgi:zinc protease
MKELLLIPSLVLLIAGCDPMPETIFPYDYTTEVLSNGLTIIMIPMESPGLVAYYSVVRTGSRDEVEPGKSGFAHFFEHMMFRGTKKYPSSVYDSLITSIGASTNAYTTDDYTAYHLNFAKEDLERVVELESDRFQNLFYEEPAFQTEAGAVYGEYKKSITSPYMLLYEKTQNLAYDVHTYKHTVIGFEEDIKAMPEAYDYSRSFFNRYYRPENVVLILVGDIDTRKTMILVEKYYGAWEKGYVSPEIHAEPVQMAERTGEVSYPGKSLPILSLAYKGDAFDTNNREFVAAMLLGDLAFGETSDLYKRLYLQEQKVESIASSIPRNRDVPLFEVYAMVKDEGDLDYVRSQIEQTIEHYQTVMVDAKRLNDLQRRRKYSFLMSLDTPNKVAGGLARYVALTGGIGCVDELYVAFDSITPEDIMNAAKKYYVSERRTIVVLKGAHS